MLPTTTTPVRRIQPVSAPRRPPDIQNRTLFPPINDSNSTSTSITPCGGNSSAFSTPEVISTPPQSHIPNPGLLSDKEKKLRRLENKLQGREEDNAECDPCNGFGTNFGSNLSFGVNKVMANATPILIKKRTCPRSAEFFAEITPEIGTKIDQIATSYSSLLDKNLTPNPNILEEISLLLQLIACSRPLPSFADENSAIIGGNLTTIAQQVFFVIKVLTLQLNRSLVSIDPEVIQLLVEKYPHRIPKPFRKNFQSWIDIRFGAVKENGEEPSRKPSEFHKCVTFRSETDGRSNFPSQGNFHAFCKQRDLFYGIKGAWEEGNIKQDLNNVTSFGKFNSSSTTPSPHYKQSKTVRDLTPADPLQTKIKALFSLNSTWVNLSHFAALFSEQFIMDSMEESRTRTKVVQDEVMKVLQMSNPDRFTKLDNRMSSISSESDSKSKDSFSFLQYFITNAASPAFNQHLVDRICFEIREIEESFDSAETGAISEADEQYLIKKTVLLSKLLGYVFFLPYREKPVDNSRPNNAPTLDTETLYSKHVDLRKHQTPPIELASFLCNALHRSRLTFTLPWIIELLSAADYVSLQLPSYKEILLLICSTYKSLCTVIPEGNSSSSSKLCLVNKNFLRFWCGNLFSLEVFPAALLYNNNTDAKLFEELVSFKKQSSITPSIHHRDSGISLDEKAGLGEQLSRFYFSANFNQMKFILHSGLQQQFLTSPSGTNQGRQHRHIRPIPADPSLKPKVVSSELKLQRQLEHSFFDGNSPSVKRTVDFVSDRIASNYVKVLRKTMPEQRTDLAKKRIFEQTAAELCRNAMLEGLTKFIDTKCQVSLSLLLGETLSIDALKVCQQITERQIVDKVSQWVQTHIKGEMFPEIPLPEVPAEAANQKSDLNKYVPSTSTIVSEDSLSFSVMISLHRCIKRFHERKPVSDSAIDDILNCSALGTVSGLLNTLLDFGVTLIAFSPSILNSTRQEKLLELWKPCWNSDCQLLSPRNMLILSLSSNFRDADADTVQKTSLSWTKLEEIILLLIKEKLLDFDTVEQDCFRLLRQDLTPQESRMMSQVLKNLLQSTQMDRSNSDDGQSREVVDWISWYCSDDQGGQF